MAHQATRKKAKPTTLVRAKLIWVGEEERMVARILMIHAGECDRHARACEDRLCFEGGKKKRAPHPANDAMVGLSRAHQTAGQLMRGMAARLLEEGSPKDGKAT